MRRTAFLASLAIALGCGGLVGPPPELHSMSITPDACGGWVGMIEASGSGDTLQLVQDGVVVGSFPIDGEHVQIPIQGNAAPLRTVTWEATLADLPPVTEQHAMPAIDAVVTVTTPTSTIDPGLPLSFDASVSSPCRNLAGFTATVKIIDPTGAVAWSTTGPLSAVPQTFSLPTNPTQEGDWSASVDVSAGNVNVGHGESFVYVGKTADRDRDGFDGGRGGSDCDDHDPEVNPFAQEAPVANGKDENCDGRIDEGTAAYDDDGDGLSEDAGDCNDNDAAVYPKAREVADCRDQNCDGQVDEGVTLVQVDDRYESNDDRDHAWDFKTTRRRSFSEEVEVVSRDGTDGEWFTFFSDDGDWDEWGVGVSVDRLPADGVYEIEVFGEGNDLRASQRVQTEGETIVVTGRAFKDDSGEYAVHIKPIRTKAWCPMTVTIWSR